MRAQPIDWMRGIPVLGLAFASAFLCGVALVVSWSFIQREELGSLRFAPLALLVLPLAVGAFLSAPIARLLGLAAARHWPLTLLWAAMALGGAYTRFGIGIPDSFFTHAMCMLGFFGTWAFAVRAGPVDTAVSMLRAMWPFWLIMLGVVVYGFAVGRHLAHEIMYVFVPLPLFWGLRAQNGRARLVAGLAIAAMAVMGLKNTTFIIGAVSIYVLWVFSQPQVRSGAARPFSLRAAAVLAVVGALAFWGWSEVTARVESFSSGNTDFRQYNYQRLWDRFLASPLAGDQFIGTPNLVFDLYQVEVGQVLPSHSDTLDILAHGGVLAFGCWMLFVAGLLRGFLATCTRARDADEYAARVTLLAISFGGLFTMCFNPVLANATNAFMFWSTLGMFAAISDPWREHERGRWWRRIEDERDLHGERRAA